MPSLSPGLWVVATPLGNPGDLSPRAREVLAGVDMVLAEDTRRAGLLFQRLGLVARRFVSCHDHNEAERAPAIIEALQQGGTAALISDAGAPLLSDPGYLLVRACRQAGITVSPVPGPSAVLAALMASGLPPYPHTFLGFLPRKSGDIARLLAEFGAVRSTLIFFERKDRLRSSLETAFQVLGDREFCLARELTKTHEEFILGCLSHWSAVSPDLRGEITVVVGPASEEFKTGEDRLHAAYEEERQRGGTPKDIARRVKERSSGWTVKEIYERFGRQHRA